MLLSDILLLLKTKFQNIFPNKALPPSLNLIDCIIFIYPHKKENTIVIQAEMTKHIDKAKRVEIFKYFWV